MHILTLFAALSRELPILLRDGAQADHEAEFVAHYALFREQVTPKATEWQPLWDKYLSRITADNPTLARAAVLDVCRPAPSAYSALSTIPTRLKWVAWSSVHR
jgi:hypothetical protein